jgi:hypothetical protein
MAREILEGNDPLNVAYQKSNLNFEELYAGTGGGGGGSSTLAGLSDVDLTLPITQDQVLKYDAVANEWENADLYLDELYNVDFTVAPTNGQVLMYSAGGVKWTAQSLTYDAQIQQLERRVKKNFIMNLMGV